MNVLFIHQNMPGQFKHLAPALAREASNRVAFITAEGSTLPPENVTVERYPRPSTDRQARGTHPYVTRFDRAVRYGQGTVRAALRLREAGFEPDAVVVHTGWGEGLFLRDLYPDAGILTFCEFYFDGRSADQNFDPQFQNSLDDVCRMRLNNTEMSMSTLASNWGITPTWWQWSRHPEFMRRKISVIHDGIDTDHCSPIDNPQIELPNGTTLTREDEVVTYVSRNFEPYRGFEPFMKSIATILERRPRSRVLLVGGDDVSYSKRAADARTWRESILSKVRFDPTRVVFLHRCSYEELRNVLSLSSAHVYLSYPFVLSWSLLESMSHECLVIGSRTPPVMEVIEHGDNGLLVDFFSSDQIADAVVNALENPDAMRPMRARARETVRARYDLKTVCLPAQVELITRVAEHRYPPPTEDGWSSLPAADGMPPRIL